MWCKRGFILIALLVTVVSIFAGVTQKDAENIVLNQILSNDLGEVDVFVQNTLRSKQDNIVISDRFLSCPYQENWVFVVDDFVFANLAHPFRYIFINEANGEFTIINESLPPLDMSGFEKISDINFTGENQLVTDPEATIENSREPNDHLFAVIISGGYNPAYNYIRYWNDMSAIFCTLTQVYGYKPENVYVHSSDGTVGNNHGSLDLDKIGPPYTNDIQYPAYESSIESTFQTLASELGSDDQLLVYVTDHGDAQNRIILWGNETITTTELDAMLDPINAAEIVVVMEQCYSGGFITNNNNITDPHRVIHTAANADEYSWAELWISNVNYDEFVFYWTAAARGRFPGVNPWELSEYEIDEFPFGDYIVYGPTHPDAYDPDLNGDGVVQMEEAFDYANNFDTWSPHGYYNTSYPEGHIGHPYVGEEEHPLQYHNIGFQEDLLCLTGITGIVENTQTVSGNFLLSETGIQIQDGVTLSIDDDSNFYLSNRSQIIANLLSTIILDNSITFLGETTTIYADPPFIPEDIPGNRIEFYGGLTVGSGIQLTVENDEYWDGLYLYGNQNVNINNGIFNHCNLINENGGLQLTSVDFTTSYLSNKNATLQIDNCNIDGLNYGIYSYANPQVSIVNSSIHDCNTGIQMNSCSNYIITNCDVYNNSGMGIFVNESYAGENEISLSDVYNNSNDGIRFYASECKVQSCNIYDNLRGIICYRGSIVEILKDPNSGSWVDDSVISNNNWKEILFIDDCTIIMDRNRNKIVDNSYTSGSWDQYLARCPNMSHNRIWRYNYWGYNGLSGAVLPPEDRFYPAVIDPDPGEIGFILSPVWDPGQPREGEEMLAETLYKEADLAVTNNNYSLADQLFKQVITLYPETEYAPASAKRLIEISNNFNELQIYYETEPNLHYNDDIDKYADYLANYCNIKMEIYEDVIIFFEDIIANPPSEIDSVMAIIDAGYTYLLMEENGNRSGFVGTMANLKPNSREDYEQNQEQLLSNLFGEPEPEPDIEPFDSILPNIPILVGNYPNPFNPTTTISFSIPNENKVELSVYNIKGQKVKTLVNNELDKGIHSVVWYGDDEAGKSVSSGVYFYKLNVNGTSNQIRKCILMK